MMRDEDALIPPPLKRALMVGAALLIVLLLVLTVRGILNGRQRRHDVQVYSQQLNAPEARQRLEAAERVLSASPGHLQAMLARSQALLDLRDPLKARAALANLQPEPGSELSHRVTMLRAEAYLQEAQAVVDTATPNSADMATENLDQILQRVDELRAGLGDETQSRFDRQLLEARALAVRANLLHTMMGREASDLARAQAVAFEEQVELVGVRVTDLRGKLDHVERRLNTLCTQMAQAAPDHPWPRVLMFQSRLRQNELDSARGLAWQLARRQPLEANVAGELAWTLLNLESGSIYASTSQDLALAQQLMDAADPGVKPLSLQMAKVTLELRRGSAPRAVELAEQLQRDYPTHLPVSWLLGRALIKANRPQQALRLLEALVERAPSAQGRHVLALAFLASGSSAAGERELRASLDLDPQNLSARIELARLLMQQGHLAEAEPDVQAAFSLNPRHPQVMALHCQLMIQRLDVKGIVEYVRTHTQDGGKQLLPRHIDLVAAMVLDDLGFVRAHLQSLGDAGWDWLAILAQVWQQADGPHRADVAAVLASTLVPAMDAQPLTRVLDPRLPSMQRAALVGDNPNAALPPVSPLEPLSEAWFFPWPHDVARELVDLARLRWPGESMLVWRALELRLWLGDLPRARLDIEQMDEVVWQSATPIARAMRAYVDNDDAALASLLGTLDLKTSPTAAWLHLQAALRGGNAAQASAALTHLLRQTGWPELALLEALREATQRGDQRQVDQWLNLAREHQPKLAEVAAARVDLSRQQPDQAVQRLQTLVQEEPDDSLARCMAAQVTARAMLAMEQFEGGAGLVESMAFTAVAYQDRWTLTGIDAMVEARRAAIAGASLLTHIPEREDAHQLDQLLARALAVVEPARLERLAGSLLSVRPDDPVLLYYRAAALLADNDPTSARQMLESLLRRHPAARRARLLLARVAVRQGATQEAQQVLAPLMQEGGLAAAVARGVLEEPPPAVVPQPEPDAPAPLPSSLMGVTP